MSKNWCDSALANAGVLGGVVAVGITRAGRQSEAGPAETPLEAAFIGAKALSLELVISQASGTAARMRKASRRIVAICRQTHTRRGRRRVAPSDQPRRVGARPAGTTRRGFRGRAT